MPVLWTRLVARTRAGLIQRGLKACVREFSAALKNLKDDENALICWWDDMFACHDAELCRPEKWRYRADLGQLAITFLDLRMYFDYFGSLSCKSRLVEGRSCNDRDV